MAMAMTDDKQNLTDAQQRLAAVYAYHQRSKHRFEAYAAGPDALDWDAQPDPFRIFSDSESVELPLLQLPENINYAAVVAGSVDTQQFSQRTLSVLLRLAFGVTAWKQLGDQRWALRANPSSGNLHPTEVWVLVQGWPDLADGLYHYDSRNHRLQRRCTWQSESNAQPQLHIALSTIYWREAWKYGERAFRYCHLDIGHALAALGFSAVALGWQATQLIDGGDAELARLLGLTRAESQAVEAESAECLLRIAPLDTEVIEGAKAISTGDEWLTLLSRTAAGQWQGAPNRLDPMPMYAWPALDEVAIETRAPIIFAPPVSITNHAAGHAAFSATSAISATLNNSSAEQIIITRRSAQAYDPNSAITREQFIALLDALEATLWQSSLPQHRYIHLTVAIHRVGEMTPGLYVLPRTAAGERLLRKQLTRWSEWRPTEITLTDSALYCIKSANVQRAVATLCCQQRIGSDSALVFGFIADFDGALKKHGAGFYRHLYWEAGALAQALYLRATALGIAGTGIGCFFDDPWHELLGIEGSALQFLYHFAVGAPLFDSRLINLSGYFHLRERERGLL